MMRNAGCKLGKMMAVPRIWPCRPRGREQCQRDSKPLNVGHPRRVTVGTTQPELAPVTWLWRHGDCGL